MPSASVTVWMLFSGRRASLPNVGEPRALASVFYERGTFQTFGILPTMSAQGEKGPPAAQAGRGAAGVRDLRARLWQRSVVIAITR